MTACAIFPSIWENWVSGMVEVKNHSAASNVISPKPAMMNSDPLLSQLACDISVPYRASWLPAGHEFRCSYLEAAAIQHLGDARHPLPGSVEMAHAMRNGGYVHQ